jgi:uncharacterized protein (DUF1330 family)
MSAYVIVEIDIVDPVGFEEYRNRVVPILEKYGAQYIVVSDRVETLEGDWKPKRIVVLQFESMERAKGWYNCEEYREPHEIRRRTARTNMVLVEGM